MRVDVYGLYDPYGDFDTFDSLEKAEEASQAALDYHIDDIPGEYIDGGLVIVKIIKESHGEMRDDGLTYMSMKDVDAGGAE